MNYEQEFFANLINRVLGSLVNIYDLYPEEVQQIAEACVKQMKSDGYRLCSTDSDGDM